MTAGDLPCLYRGTSPGWPGNESLQIAKMTCTTTDPLVATFFAIACRNHGHGIVLIAPRSRFDSLIGPSNFLEMIECAVNIKVLPEDFERQTICHLDVDTSLAILADLGFSTLPIRINGAGALRDSLQESHDRSQRLSPEQIVAFNRRVFGEGP